MTEPTNTPDYQTPASATGPGGEVTPNPVVQTVWAGINILCCWPLAIVGLIFGILAITKKDTDPVDASKKATIAKYVNIAGTVIGLIIAVLYIVGVILAASSGAAGQ